MAKRQVYMARMQERLGIWTAKFEALATKAGDEAKTDLHKWKAGADVVAAKLTELMEADHKWYAIKAEMEKALHGIEAALGGNDPRAPGPVNGAGKPVVEPKAATPTPEAGK